MRVLSIPTDHRFLVASAALGIALGLGACRTADDASVQRREQLSVYQALIDSCYLTPTDGNAAQPREVFLSEHLEAPDTLYDADRASWLQDSVPGLPSDAIKAFWRVRSDTSAVVAFPLRRQRLHIISDSTLGRFFSRHVDTLRSGWAGFRRAYPLGGGIVSLSRVGFSRDGRWAIVYAGQQSDWLAGAGYLHVLRKDSAHWRIVRQLRMWVS